MQTDEQAAAPVKAPRRQADRAGKRTVATHLDNDIARGLRILAAKSDRTINDLVREAVIDVLAKHNQEAVPK